ncbi:MAG: hypothetical protein ACTMIZ_16365, partial [Cellulosimicrobium funkei]
LDGALHLAARLATEPGSVVEHAPWLTLGDHAAPPTAVPPTAAPPTALPPGAPGTAPHPTTAEETP